MVKENRALQQCPSNDIVAVVVDPAPDARVVHRGQSAEGLVAAVMKRPVPDLPADARQCLGASNLGSGLLPVTK